MVRYKDAVRWIAYNDEPTLREIPDAPEMARLISVALVADLWNKNSLNVAEDVIRERRLADKQEANRR